MRRVCSAAASIKCPTHEEQSYEAYRLGIHYVFTFVALFGECLWHQGPRLLSPALTWRSDRVGRIVRDLVLPYSPPPERVAFNVQRFHW